MLKSQLENLKIGDKLKLSSYGVKTFSNMNTIEDVVFEVKEIIDRYEFRSFKLAANIGYGVFGSPEVLDMFEVIEKPKTKVITNPDLLPKDVRKVICNGETTIVILHSGVKAISKPMEGDEYSSITGFNVALLKARIKEMQKELKKY